MVIDFSGTAGQIRNAFKTEMHRLNVKGVEHIANASDPQIPAALAPIVSGFASTPYNVGVGGGIIPVPVT